MPKPYYIAGAERLAGTRFPRGKSRGPQLPEIQMVETIARARRVARSAILMACATLCMIAMEERPLAGPGTAPPAQMAE